MVWRELPVGLELDYGLLDGRRHGVLVEHRTGLVSWRISGTRWGARRAYRDVQNWVTAEPDSAGAGTAIAYLVERRQIKRGRYVRTPGEQPPPDAGVREPRRPRPSLGGAAAIADVPLDWI
jgi:hypothetical protein